MKILLLTCLLSLGVVLAAVGQSYSGGAGTSGNPYQIANKTDLKYLSEHSADWSKHFIQTADIIFEDADFQNGGDFYNSGVGFSPIGNSTTQFTGSYDGQGNVINGVYISRGATDNIGLFGYVRTATIANITLLNANVTGNNYAAIAIGRAEGTSSSSRESSSISNCYMQGNISGALYVGGLIGRCENSNATITNCHANVSASSTTAAGGNSIVGGLIGGVYDQVGVTVTNCSSSGSVSANGRNVGGLIGYVSGGTYQKCFSTANISINSSSNDGNHGGFIGGVNARYQSTTIQNCYALGNVTGGINNSSVDWERGVGGFIGTIRINYSSYTKNISNCYAAGIVTQSGISSYIGGFIGYRDPDGSATVTNCYWDSERSTQATSLYGTGLTTAQMKVQGNFTSWDFSNTWRMSSGITYDGYPTLEWAKGYATAPTSSQIADLSNLVYVAENSSRWATSYTQTADVNAWWTCGWDYQKGWTPIGNNTTKYTGTTYDGDNYEINHLYINRTTSDYQGLFGYLNNAEVKDLGLNHVNISARSSLAGIAGSADNGTIRNCFVTGKVAGIGLFADFTGGLIGDSRGNSLVEYCYTNMTVSGRHHVGGLAGRVLNNSSTSIVRYCYSLGTVTGTGSHVGGLAGGNSGTITNSYSLVNVGGTGTNVGGLVGNNWYGIITNSYSAGSVTGSLNLGGLVGATTGSTVTNSFWDTQTSGRANSNGGTGKTTTEMKTQNTFTNWDFATIWNISDFSATNYSSYPYLRSNEQTPLPGYENIAITWNGSVSSAWNTPGNWSNNNLPTSLNNITIADVANDPVISSGVGASCNNLTINSGASLTVASGGTLITNGAVSGDITIQREITGSSTLTANKYHLVSVPLHPDNNSLSGLFLDSYLYNYVPVGNSWASMGTSTTTPLNETVGYMIYYPNASTTYSFTGQPNTGTFTPTVTYAGNSGSNYFALVPNPYPSNIDWNAASGWTKTNIGSTIWVYNNGSYATWNGTTGTNSGSRYIAVGQAFFVQTTASSPSLIMGNGVRTHNSATFLKNNVVPANQLRVKALANNMQDEIIAGFAEGMSTNYDPMEDALKLYGAGDAPQLYTLAGDSKVSINQLAELNGSAEIPMHFETEFSGEIALEFSQIESFPADLAIQLEDKLTGQWVNLRETSQYHFAHNPANTADRFVLHFGSAAGFGENENRNISSWFSGNTFYLSTPEYAGEKAKVEVFSVSGQLLFSQEVTLSNLQQFNLNVKGAVITRVTLNNKVLNTKAIVL